MTYEISYRNPARNISGKVLVPGIESVPEELRQLEAGGSIVLRVGPADWDIEPAAARDKQPIARA